MLFDSSRELPSSLICHSVVHEKGSIAWGKLAVRETFDSVHEVPLASDGYRSCDCTNSYVLVGLSLGDRGTQNDH